MSKRVCLQPRNDTSWPSEPQKTCNSGLAWNQFCLCCYRRFGWSVETVFSTNATCVSLASDEGCSMSLPADLSDNSACDAGLSWRKLCESARSSRWYFCSPEPSDERLGLKQGSANHNRLCLVLKFIFIQDKVMAHLFCCLFNLCMGQGHLLKMQWDVKRYKLIIMFLFLQPVSKTAL